MQVKIVGIVNITADSFSDGGLYLDPLAALAYARRLAAEGADLIELGPASSHPRACQVSPTEEISRIAPLLETLKLEGLNISIDSFQPETQIYAAQHGCSMLNDIQGFPSKQQREHLSKYSCQLVVMHSVQRQGKADYRSTDVSAVIAGIYEFFESRLAQLQEAGVKRSRLILDPGMGFFLGQSPGPSIAALLEIPKLRSHFQLPLLLSVSRKSFLRTISGEDLAHIGPATLAAELFCAAQGVDYIRTHDVRALHSALKIQEALW